ncbi:hypothetical protein ACPXCO_37350 [Streptomyces cyaneofuscatus]|uniref:hypothetical protein n=1 Tax=Streptomyces cyaneofuscatus TaxID=66883 RepID=UPI003CF214AD
MATTITQRRTRARRLYTGEPHTIALNEVRRHRDVLPAASTGAQQDLEARVLAALANEFDVHRPGDQGGPFALAWVGPREDSLILAVAEPHRQRVLRCLLEAGCTDSRGAHGLEQRRTTGQWITLTGGPAGGTLLLPRDHGPALLRAEEDPATRLSSGKPQGSLPPWAGTPSGQERASAVLRRIRLFADRDAVDFGTELPGDAVLAGPHPELLMRAGRPHVIAVVNAKGGHGCSSLATGLAQALTSQDHRVLYLATSPGGQGGPGLQGHQWPEADPGLAAVAQDPDRHVRPLPGLGHSFVRCSSPGADGPDQARQLARLLRHPSIDDAFSHVVIDASPTGLPHAAAGTADLTLVPWRHMPRPPGREVTEVHLSPLGEVWAWLKDAYRHSEPAELEDYYAYGERLEQFTREHGTREADNELEDGLARRMFLYDTDEAGRQRWGTRWEVARDGWIAHLLHEKNTGWDEAAGARVPRTLSNQEWEAVLYSGVAKAADELLWNLPVFTRRRRPWLVPTTRMPAEVVRTLREACTAQDLRLSSTVLPDVGNAVLPASRARWEDAARRLAVEACAQLPR